MLRLFLFHFSSENSSLSHPHGKMIPHGDSHEHLGEYFFLVPVSREDKFLMEISVPFKLSLEHAFFVINAQHYHLYALSFICIVRGKKSLYVHQNNIFV
jgi:hypothetical protein